MHVNLFRILLCLLGCALGRPGAVADTIEFETTQVTQADVALSPDGQTLIFSMLGHLFQLPVEGGTAEQLTFGPYYDTDHAFSPDGARVAFVSDRDGSEGNVFILKLATGTITQVTHESWAGRPKWTPDGQALVYLRFERAAWSIAGPRRSPAPAVVRRVPLRGGDPETLSVGLKEVRSVFHLPDGRVGWVIVERDTTSPRATTRIEVTAPDGTVSVLRTLDGIVDRVVASPTGDGLYARHYIPLAMRRELAQQREVLFIPLPEGIVQPIIPVSGISFYQWPVEPRFAVATDNAALFVGNLGRLWKVTLPRGEREPIPFRARVTLEVQEPVPPPRWTIPEPGRSASPRSIHSPWLSPDGQRLVFLANRSVWEQPLAGGPVRRLVDGAVGLAYSPDGRQLAFIHWEGEVRVFDFASDRTRTVASGDFDRDLKWSSDGERLILMYYDEDDLEIVVAVNVNDGTKKGVEKRSDPSLLTQEGQEGINGRVSPNGQWLTFQPSYRMELRVIPLGGERVTAEDARPLSPPGGNWNYTFTHDGSAVVYATGNRVWRHPLNGGKREEIPVRLKIERPTPPPVLLQRVRVLDFVAGGFGPETSLLIQAGRIRWIGAERGRQLPQGTVTIDAAGRFAIPGLYDMHGHGGDCGKNSFIAYGVTSVRNMGGPLDMETAQADRSAFTGEPVPRCFYAGEILDGPQGTGAIHLYDEEDARAYVRLWKERGAQFIKLSFMLPWPLHRAASDEARRLGLPVVAHGNSVEEVVKGVTLGYSLTHWRRFYDDVLQMLAAAGTRIDPTLIGDILLMGEEAERVADPKFRAFFPKFSARADLFLLDWWYVGDDALRGMWVDQLRSIQAAYRHGVTLLTGTDDRWNGPSLHWQLEFFAEAGIPPLDVLRFATLASAETVGAGDDLGTLEVGKLADIVLLNANPLEDIKNTQTIWRVIKGGWLFDPEKLRPPESVKMTE